MAHFMSCFLEDRGVLLKVTSGIVFSDSLTQLLFRTFKGIYQMFWEKNSIFTDMTV